jgi:MFS family permease
MDYQTPPNGFRTFLIIWATQSVSVVGSAITYFAVTIWLTQILYPLPDQKPALGFALALDALAFALPAVLAAPLAGAWTDRHDRKRIMVLMDFAKGGLSLVLAALLVTHQLQLWSLLLLGALASFLGAFHGAAFDASYAMIVPEEQLPKANGMMQTMWSLSGLVAPALAMGLIALPSLALNGALPGLAPATLGSLADGIPLAIFVDALTFFLAAAALLFLQVPSPAPTGPIEDANPTDGGLRADLAQGIAYVTRRRSLLWLLLTFTVANLLASPNNLVDPLLLKTNLLADWTARGFSFESALALLTTVGSVGGIVGGVVISAWGGLRSRRVYGVILTLLVAGLAQFLVGVSSLLYLTAALKLLIDAMIPMMNAHSQSIWQVQTPRELQGRVFAVRRVIAQCSYPLGTVAAGWAAGVLGPGLVMAVCGASLAAFCAAQLFNGALLQVGESPAAPDVVLVPSAVGDPS